MSIEVCNPYGSDWRVYFTDDPSDVAEQPQWGEYMVTWESTCYPDAEERAHRYAKAMRLPGGQEQMAKHFRTVTTEPLWQKECGCHETEDHYWVDGPNCLHAQMTA